MSRSDDMPRKKGISVLNWIGTLLLAMIPGVNIIALVLMAIFAKARSKRTFAAAYLILTAILVVLSLAAFLIFSEPLLDFAQKLREAQVGNPTVLP